mgnify:CR=1 FL=1
MKKSLFLILVSLFVWGLNQTTYSQVLEGPPRDGVFDRTATMQVQPIPYPYLREADIIWTKRIWRVLDMREKLNQTFYFPEKPQNNWKSFMQIIMDGLKEGTITAYSALSDQFLVPNTYKELMDQLQSTKSMTLKRPYEPYDDYDTVITKNFEAADVKLLRIKEDFMPGNG